MDLSWENGGVLRVAAVVEQCWHRVPGGTAVATVRTLAALAARDGVQTIGVTARHRNPPLMTLPPSMPIRSGRLPRRVLYDSWHYLRRPRVQRFVGEVDVVHATGGAIPPPGRAALVTTVHDLAFLRRPEWFTRRGTRFASRAFELARAEAAVMLVPSRATARDCAERGVASDRIRVVPWGVAPTAVTDKTVKTVRRRYRLPRTFALWVGTAEPRKNLRRLLEAASRTTSGVPLVLAGPQGWRMDLSALVAASSADVISVGYVTEHELAALYAAARVFVYPSLMEGFGLPVLEAMAQGTPVVTSRGTATEEVCADPASTVDPTDVDALASAIDIVVTDDTEHARRAAAAKARAAELTWDKTAARVHSAYAEAAG